jgi:MFS family permease
MLTRNWKTWLGVLLAVAFVGGGLYALLYFQGFATAANIVSILATVVGGAWTLRGLYVWREVPWVRRVNSFVILGLGFGLAYLVLRAVGASVLAGSTLYLFGTVAGFLLGVNLIRLLLAPGWPVFGVARAMVEEAIRSRIAIVLGLMLLLILVALPQNISSDDRLTYIVQRFLTWSLMAVSFLLSITTIVLCAYTTSYDLKSKQVYMTLTKPLGRGQYLLGKWLGVVLLNGVLLAVTGVAIAGFTRALSQGQAMNAEDREQVQREILTARISNIPSPVGVTTDEMMLNMLAEKQRIDPEEYGEPGSPASSLPEHVRQAVYTEALTQWFTVNPDESESFLFTGLGSARANAAETAERAVERLIGHGLTDTQARAFVEWQNFRGPRPDADLPALMTEEEYTDIVALINREKVQLVISPYSRPEPDDGMVEFWVTVNGLGWPIGSDGRHRPTKVAVDTPQELSLPAWLINEAGELLVTIEVPPVRLVAGQPVPQQAIQFNRKDQVPEVFYRVGSFEGNLVKSMAVLWVRLAFLAMLGLALGSLFTFPVASLIGLMVYAVAAFSGYLSEAVTDYASVGGADTTWGVITAAFGRFFAALGEGQLFEAFKLLVRLVAQTALLIVPSFGEFNPGPNLSEGKAVPPGMLYGAVLRVGLLWTGVVGLIGLILFHRRELAKVTA